MKTRNSKINNNAILTFLLLIGAFAVILGGTYAYFSDWVQENVSVTAGTLDIDGTYTFEQNGTTVTQINNFNPGDVAVAKGSATNSGNKSAWIHGVVDFGTLNSDISSYIKVYKGAKTAAQIEAAPTTDLIATSNKIDLGNKIIDGTGTGAETETGTDAIGSNVYNQDITIYFDKAALNAAQGKSVNFTYRFEALQYRNNTAAPNWSATTIEQI